MGILAIAEEISGAGAAFSGLILVFLGFAVAGYDSYESTQKKSVRGRFQLRAWLAFTGLAFSIAATGAALVSEAAGSECAAWISVFLIAVAAVVVLLAALIVALDVR